MNAVTIIRGLLGAGWKSNSRTEMCDGSIVLDGTRGDSTITAVVSDDGTTGLMLTGLTTDQVTAALTAVGHMRPVPAIPRRPLVGWSPATRAAAQMLRQRGLDASGRVSLPPGGVR